MERVEPPNSWRNNVLSRGDCKCKGPETGVCQACSKNSKEASVAKVERGRGTVGKGGQVAGNWSQQGVLETARTLAFLQRTLDIPGGGSELRRGVIRSPWLPSAVWLVGAEEEAGRPVMVQGAMVVACFKVGRVRPAQTLDLC